MDKQNKITEKKLKQKFPTLANIKCQKCGKNRIVDLHISTEKPEPHKALIHTQAYCPDCSKKLDKLYAAAIAEINMETGNIKYLNKT